MPYLRLLVLLVPIWQLIMFGLRFMIAGLLLALLSMLFTFPCKHPLDFGTRLRMALYAQLAPSLLVLAFDAGFLDFSLSWLVKMTLFALASCIFMGLAMARHVPHAPATALASVESAPSISV